MDHASDASDPNLPLMIWYALEPWVGAHPADAVKWLPSMKIPKLRELVTRRLASL